MQSGSEGVWVMSDLKKKQKLTQGLLKLIEGHEDKIDSVYIQGVGWFPIKGFIVKKK